MCLGLSFIHISLTGKKTAHCISESRLSIGTSSEEKLSPVIWCVHFLLVWRIREERETRERDRVSFLSFLGYLGFEEHLWLGIWSREQIREQEVR